VASAPSFRPDVAIEEDVIEEIARIHGYENILETLPSFPLQGKDSIAGRFVEELRQSMMAAGMQEVLTHSVVDPVSVELSGLGEKIIPLKNPLSEDVSRMRPSLAPNLLQVIARNQAVGEKDISIFEGGIHEFRSAAGAMVGTQWGSAWSLPKESLAADFYLLKGALLSVFARIGITNVVLEPAEHALLHPTRSAKVLVDGKEVGVIGEVSPEARETLDLRGRPCVFEFDVEKLMGLVPVTVGYKQLPRFPALYRHLAVVLSRDVPYARVEQSISESGGEIVQGVELLDVYTGSQVGENEKSLTLSLVFRSPERTLTDEEVNGVLESVKTELASAFGASFRG
jgi:phenylalanyl-tRNA synthetase beta chain